MTGFNDGIEAAAKRRREISHEGLKDSWWRERFESAARAVESLKRPEPSEGDARKIGMAMREAVRNVCKGPTLSDELTDEQYAALFRAALKAMEG